MSLKVIDGSSTAISKWLREREIKFKVKDLKTGKIYDKDSSFEELVLELNKTTDCKLIYCDMESFAIDQNGDLLLIDECGNSFYVDEKRFVIHKKGESKC
jgi:hypothetical protein